MAVWVLLPLVHTVECLFYFYSTCEEEYWLVNLSNKKLMNSKVNVFVLAGTFEWS